MTHGNKSLRFLFDSHSGDKTIYPIIPILDVIASLSVKSAGFQMTWDLKAWLPAYSRIYPTLSQPAGWVRPFFKAPGSWSWLPPAGREFGPAFWNVLCLRARARREESGLYTEMVYNSVTSLTVEGEVGCAWWWGDYENTIIHNSDKCQKSVHSHAFSVCSGLSFKQWHQPGGLCKE